MISLRLSRYGAKKRAFYRLVAADRRFPRDGRFLEQLGTYDPNANPAKLNFKMDRVTYWMDHGAKPSTTVRTLLRELRRRAQAEAKA